MNGRAFTVVGVAPPELTSRFMRMKVDGWVPFGIPGGVWHATQEEMENRRDHDATIFARLAPGQSVASVQAEMNLLAGHFIQEHPDAWTDDRGEARTLTVLPERDSHLPPDGKAALAGLAGLLFVGAFLILLLACSNVTGLFLARAHKRRREMAIRLSLGATRSRLAGLLLAEGLVLSLAGRAGGLALTWWFAEFMAEIPFPIDLPLAFDVGVDLRVVGFALALSLGATILFGLAPALRASRPDLVTALKADSADTGRRRGRLGLRNVLVLGQVAASLTLLVPAGLFLRTLQESARLDLGFNPERVAILWKELPAELQTPEGAAQFTRDLKGRLTTLPGVEGVELASRVDAATLEVVSRAVLEIPGFQREDGRPVVHSYSSITPGFVKLMEIPLLRGRSFTEADGPGAQPVALVNEAFIHRYWPEGTGLGNTFTILERREVDTPLPAPPTTVQVVGVVQDPPFLLPGSQQGPSIWLPYAQDHPTRAVIHLKGRSSAAEMVSILRREIRPDPGEPPLIPAQTYRDAIRGRFMGQGIASKLLAWAGLFALALAVIGFYGIVSFAVNLKIRETAIRQAMGAPRREIFRSLVREGMFLTLGGVLVGLAISIPVGFLLRHTLYGVAPLDPLVLGGGTGILALSAFVASLLPSLRAMRVDPMDVLREE